MNFSYNFFFLITKFVLKVSVIAQVIKNYIFPSGGKSNDPLHIDYVPNVFKFTKIQQNEPKNHSNGMNEHKNVKGDKR